MSKVVIIPDVHGDDFWKKAVKDHESDTIVFLGDYLDSYSDMDRGAEWNNFLEIVEFKKQHMDNVHLLLGNHDCGYLFGLSCSRRDPDPEHCERNRKFFEDNLDLFDLTYYIQGAGNGKYTLVFSHAGLLPGWVTMSQTRCWTTDLKALDNPFMEQALGMPLTVAEEGRGFLGSTGDVSLNKMLHNKDHWENGLIPILGMVSTKRGGQYPAGCGSVVWADIDEFSEYNGTNGNPYLMTKPCGRYIHPKFFQIFGHTNMARSWDGSIIEDAVPVLACRNPEAYCMCCDIARGILLDTDTMEFNSMPR